jgi:peptidoglycan/xylan/chitin deacetylase (PgdA/CDA1 family)
MNTGNASATDSTVARKIGQTIVTTSWDDGHRLDSRLAALLSRYAVPATFYVSPENREIPVADRLSNSEISSLAADFEIGGHTQTHARLTQLNDADAMREIVVGKDSLEQVIGRSVDSFCYPGGAYRQRHIPIVRSAGFTMARTVRRGYTAASPRYEVATTCHAYRHLVDIARAVSLGRQRGIAMYMNWDDAAIALFHRTLASGGVYHLWGHSWEIDKHDDWHRLERVLRVIGGRTDVVYAENRALQFAAQ